MGRKLQAKSTSNNRNGVKEYKYTLQKLKQISVLIDKVLELTSLFQTSGNTLKSWDQHLELDFIIKEIINIEESLNTKSNKIDRLTNVEKYLHWLRENGAVFEGVEICEFDGYGLGLKALKDFSEDSLILSVPSKIMITEKDALESELGAFVKIDPVLKSMANVTLALFLLLEKSKSDSFWKPYIDILPDKYTTVLYFTLQELNELKPSPMFEASLKLYRSISRQYAYFYNKIHTMDIPVLKKLQDIFTFENYRWAVSTVMTRQNNVQVANNATTAFIPLWDMCNHEHGKITTDFNKELNRGECYALRDFKAGEQIFIFYGARSNGDLFLHNGFVYPHNQHDSLSLVLGISFSDPARETRLLLLSKLGLSGVTHFNLYQGDAPVSPELLAFIRIFNMNQEELTKWSSKGIPGDLVSSEPSSVEVVGLDLDKRAYTYLLTRCKLIQASYKKNPEESPPDNVHRKNIKLLKECELKILNGAIKYLEKILEEFPTVDK